MPQKPRHLEKLHSQGIFNDQEEDDILKNEESFE